VIHKNYWYSDADKYRMVEGVATQHRKLLKHMAWLESQSGGVDMILKPGFRKGMDYEVEEARLHALAQLGMVEEDNSFVQEPTDWSVQAVVDEDQL
jgi:hypothetical protein